MASILLVQCNRLVSGVQYPGISCLSAFALKAGHRFLFFDTANYSSPADTEAYKSVKPRKLRIDLEFKQVEGQGRSPLKKPINRLLKDFETAIRDNQPDLVGFSSFSDDWPFALFLIKKARAIDPDVPIIVGGIHATVAPQEVIRHPEVDMVCIGEGEMPLVELLDSIDAKKISPGIKNLWIKHNGQVFKNGLRPLIRLGDDFPRVDWSLYNDINFYHPFEGRLFRRGSVFNGRGCPYSCSFCINDFFKKIYPKESAGARNFGVSYLIEQTVELKNKYKLEALRFWDETFLAMPKKYLLEFSREYAKKIALPFTIETTAQTINPENARMLVEMGCRSISVGVETSNEELRSKIFNKKVTNEMFDKCFKVISDHGIRKVANFMFFLPHETIGDMRRDIDLCRKWDIDHAAARIFYPYRGTSLRDYCLKNGLVDVEMLSRLEDEGSIKDIEDLRFNYMTFGDTVLKFDQKTKKEGHMLLDNFILFQETDPEGHRDLEELISRNDPDSDRRLMLIERDIYKKRFGCEPAMPG